MLAWTPSLTIGVAEIDAQHQKLFDWVAKLDAAVKRREPYSRLEGLFAFLRTYALAHLAAEEVLMWKVAYSQFPEHLREHLEFRQWLGSLEPQWESEGDSTATMLEVLTFLEYWLASHVATSDQRIGEYMRG
jgi:hemerythrin-like metal-binding protein